MPNSHLPDNYQQWPTNPYQLLGVSPSADKLTVKRVYTQLILKFKPEKSPGEFKRIRAAYEQVLAQIERQKWHELVAPIDVLTVDPKPRAEEGNSNPDALATRSAEQDGQPSGPQKRSVTIEAWDLAKQGKPIEAFALLREWHEQVGGQEEQIGPVDEQLYWLSKLFPELNQNPIKWLADGIQRNPRYYPILALLKRELQERPEIAFDPLLSHALLEVRALETMVPLMQLRWDAMAKSDKPYAILDDIENLEEELKYDHEELWHNLLACGVSAYLASAYHCKTNVRDAVYPHGFAAIHPYVEELGHSRFHRSLETDLDQLDWLRSLTQGLVQDQLHQNHAFLRKWGWFIRQQTILHSFKTELLLPHLIEDLVLQPAESLAILDQIQVSYPTMMRCLSGAILRYAELRQVDLKDEPIVETQIPYPPELQFRSLTTYDKDFRPFIAHHAFSDVSHPTRVVERLVGLRDFEELYERVYNDEPLNILYLAWYAFHYEPFENQEPPDITEVIVDERGGGTSVYAEEGPSRGFQMTTISTYLPAILIVVAFCVAVGILWNLTNQALRIDAR